jgi:hypothetical protein
VCAPIGRYATAQASRDPCDTAGTRLRRAASEGRPAGVFCGAGFQSGGTIRHSAVVGPDVVVVGQITTDDAIHRFALEWRLPFHLPVLVVLIGHLQQ